MNLFEKIHPYSKIKGYDFIWVAEYLDGTLLFQFDDDNYKENNFNKIDRSKLIRYGLIGNGYRLYYNAANGSFNFFNRDIEIYYKVNGKEYPLTNANIIYNDPIYFQEAYMDFNANAIVGNGVYGYNFGYKCKIKHDDTTFYFKPIFKIQENKPLYMKIWLVADKDLSGELIIRVNNLKEYKYSANLEKNIGGELTWIVK